MNRMIFVNLPVRDLRATRRFYTGVGFTVDEVPTFDTLRIQTGAATREIVERALASNINLRVYDDAIGISCDEVTSAADLESLLSVLAGTPPDFDVRELAAERGVPDGPAVPLSPPVTKPSTPTPSR